LTAALSVQTLTRPPGVAPREDQQASLLKATPEPFGRLIFSCFRSCYRTGTHRSLKWSKLLQPRLFSRQTAMVIAHFRYRLPQYQAGSGGDPFACDFQHHQTPFRERPVFHSRWMMARFAPLSGIWHAGGVLLSRVLRRKYGCGGAISLGLNLHFPREST